jgi:hypothetical protein
MEFKTLTHERKYLPNRKLKHGLMAKRKAVPIDPDGAGAEGEGADALRPKRNAARATLIRPVFDAVDKKHFGIKERTSTIPVSLIGRVAEDTRVLFDDLACYTSQVAQVASRLAAFVVERRLQKHPTPDCLERLLEPDDLNCGAAFFMDCLKWCAHDKASSDRVTEAEFLAFQEEFTVAAAGIRRTEFAQYVTSMLHTKRDEMCKDTKKHLTDSINAKPLMWLKHQLRMSCWNECLASSLATASKSRLTVARDTIHTVAKAILTAAWADEDDWMPVESTCSFGVVYELYSHLHEWFKLFRPYAWSKKKSKSDVPVARQGLKKAPHVALWILSQMCKDFDEAGVERAEACRKYQGNLFKAERKRALNNLQEWQQRAPSHFELMPNKPAHKVNFLTVSMSVGKDIVRLLWKRRGLTDISDELKRMHDDPFWWSRLLILDDPERAEVDGRDSYKGAWCNARRLAIKDRTITAGFRACGSRVKLPGTRCKYLSRICGLASSQEHFDYLRAHTSTQPVLLTAFRTNGRELHLIVEKSSMAPSAPSDRPAPTVRRRSFGFDQLHKRGFKALRNDDNNKENEPESACALDLTRHRYGVYGEVVTTKKPLTAVVVDPGQIHPLAYAAVTVDPAKPDPTTAELTLIPKAAFELARGTAACHDWQKRRAKEDKEYNAYMKQLGDDSITTPAGGSRAVAKLRTEAANWKKMSVLRTSMIHRDHSLKRKRQRKSWIRNLAIEWKKAQVDVVCFGNGTCAARGHRRLPTKSLMHEIGTIMPLVVLDEFGTSSRCPECRRQDKLTRSVYQPTAPQVSGEDFPSTDDTRGEYCARCERTWAHDEVSVHNLAAVTFNMFIGTARPSWLQRTK